MKSKKIIASLMALSIIGSGSLVFGGTAKAATLNGPSNKSLSSPWIGYKLNTDISSNGGLTWAEVTGANRYEFKVIYIKYGQQVFAGGGGETYKQEDLRHNLPYSGKYYVNVRAYDSNNKIMDEETVYFYYDGVSRYTME